MKIVGITTKVIVAAPAALGDHMLDEKRPVHHRMTTGVIVMSAGVAIAKVAGHSPIGVLASWATVSVTQYTAWG